MKKKLIGLASFFVGAAMLLPATSLAVGEPSAPSYLMLATPPYPGVINLKWVDTSSDEDFFKVERQLPGDNNWAFLAQVASSSVPNVYYSDTNVTVGMTYNYQVSACRTDVGCSVNSAFLSSITVPATTGGGTVSNTTTPTTLPPPAAPTSLHRVDTTNLTSVYLTWTDNSTDETFFNIERRVPGGNWSFLVSPPANSSVQGYFPDTTALPGATYEYGIQACRSGYGCSDYTYSPAITIAQADTISPSTPTGVSAYINSNHQVSLNWSAATDNVAVVRYSVFRNNLQLTGVTAPGYVDSNVTASNTYSYYVIAYDAAGNPSASSAAVSVTIPPPQPTADTVAPVLPTGLSAYAYPQQIRLGWQVASDNVGVTKYSVFKNNNRLVDVTTTYYYDSAVTAGTAYVYYVVAYDAAGNHSNQSEAKTITAVTTTVTTSSTTDTAAPTAPSNLQARVTSINHVYLNWTASTDNVGVAGYKIFKDGVMVASTTNISFDDGAVTPGMGYNYYLQAYDAAGHLSVYSGSIHITLPSVTPSTANTPTTTTQTTSNATVSQLSGSNSDYKNKLSWLAVADNAGAVGYRIYRNGSLYATTTLTTFTDSNVSPGTTYLYSITAFDKNGISIGSSQVITLFVPAAIASTTPAVAIIPAGLEVSVVDASGVLEKEATVYLTGGDQQTHPVAFVGANGSFNFELPPGYYTVNTILPSSMTDLIRPPSQQITLSSGEKKQLQIVVNNVATVDRVVNGKVALPNGQPVTDAQIDAYSVTTGQWLKTNTDSNGAFNFHLGGGTWQFRALPQNPTGSTWSSEVMQTIAFSSNTSETKEVNFTVSEMAAVLNVSLIDDSGNPINEAGITIEPAFQAYTAVLSPQYSKSNSAGTAEFRLVPGKYIVRSFLLDSTVYLNPGQQTIDITTAGQKIVMIFKNIELAKIQINGQIKYTDGSLAGGAFVTAWSKGGGITDLQADSSGHFTIQSQVGDTWHLGAGILSGNVSYKSYETILPVKSSSINVNLILIKNNLNTAAADISSKTDNPALAIAGSGASVYVPPQTVTSSNGLVNISVSPTIQTPSRPGARVIGQAYDVKIKDTNGNEIKQFNSDLEISLPYDDATLKALGASTNTIKPSYFDESTGAWVQIANYSVDKIKHVVTLHVRHLTRFALVAMADTVPPAPPSKISAIVEKVGTVKLVWVNPVADFHHVKIYRSEKSSTIGTLINDLVMNSSFKEAKLKKKTYYYTLRSVDAAGNESKNAKKIAVNAARVTPKPKKVAAKKTA